MKKEKWNIIIKNLGRIAQLGLGQDNPITKHFVIEYPCHSSSNHTLGAPKPG